MTQLCSKLPADYASESQLVLKKTIGKLVGDRVVQLCRNTSYRSVNGC
ncbi:hypothetical protein [Dapis sp. BLCC M172]